MASFIPRNSFGRWLTYEFLWLAGSRRFAAFNIGFAPVSDEILAMPAFAAEPSQIQLYAELCEFAQITAEQWRSVRLLEAGCGAGLGLVYIGGKYRPARLTGLDYAAIATARARRRGLDVRRGRADALPFADASFDYVLCVDSLNNFPGPAFMSESVRVLAADGKILIGDFYLGSLADAQARLESLAAPAGLRISRFQNCSESVVRAIERDHDRKTGLIAKLPDAVRKALGETMSLKGSVRYRQWQTGERIYYFAMLERV